MGAKLSNALILIVTVPAVFSALLRVPENHGGLQRPGLQPSWKMESPREKMDELIRHVFVKLDEKMDKLGQKIEQIGQQTEMLNDKVDRLDEILDTNVREMVDRSLNTIYSDPEENLGQKRTIDDMTRRQTDGLHVSEVFVTMYEKAIETSSGVKTLLEKTDDVLESVNECGRIPDILEEIQNQCGKEEETVCEKPKSCLDLLKKGHTLSGVYKIHVESLEKDIEVYCDQETEGGGWIVFQRRKDGSVDFYRDWNDYKIGFGNALGEFWLGLDYLHDLTATGSHELWIDMEDFEQGASYAKYSTFKVGPESEKYVLTATDYSGNAGDALNLHHNGRPFSTKDADNDASGSHCAKSFGGGWWYGGCHNANLNGLYLGGAHKSYANGINWGPWKGHHYSLKFVEMKFREKTTQ